MRLILSAASAMCLLAIATPAHAELVFFTTGSTLSVKGHRIEEDRLILELRGGGEIMCDRTLVARIGPDEVPYPEPEDPSARVTADVTQASTQDGSVRLQPDATPDQSRYGAIIDKVATEHGVSPKLVHAVIQVESGYQERARSPKGAMGLMQLMPATAHQYAVSDPYDPVANIEAGITHLKSLLDRFPLALALAAYNAGEAAVARFHGIPPYPETRDYVSRILKLAAR